MYLVLLSLSVFVLFLIVTLFSLYSFNLRLYASLACWLPCILVFIFCIFSFASFWLVEYCSSNLNFCHFHLYTVFKNLFCKCLCTAIYTLLLCFFQCIKEYCNSPVGRIFNSGRWSSRVKAATQVASELLMTLQLQGCMIWRWVLLFDRYTWVFFLTNRLWWASSERFWVLPILWFTT